MKYIKIVSILIILAVIGFWILLNTTVIFVPVGKVGVMTREYAVTGKRGVVEEDFKPGWHWDMGPLHSWTLFDSTVQALEMTRNVNYGDRMGRDDVEVQSADGYAVSVDVTVKYRILKDKAFKLYQDTGSGIKYKTIVRTEAKDACIAMFGEMETEDFYDPAKRREKALQVQNKLHNSLADNYVEVIDVLIKNVQFDPEYEKKIQRKKLADQEVQLNISMARAEEMSGKTQVIVAETGKMLAIITQEQAAELIKMEALANRQIAKIKADYESFATRKNADADLIAAQQDAKGQLLVKTAEAEGEKLRNEAMRGVGGSTIVALEAARNLNLDDMIISTMNIDLLDIDAMAKKLGASSKKK
jgi:regulator of protease activity HflC (stomatin/prohibitin superfamily)